MQYNKIEVLRTKSAVEANDFYEIEKLGESLGDDLYELDYPMLAKGETDYVVWRLEPKN